MDSPNPERERLEQLYIDGGLEIIARRQLKAVKTYKEYIAESQDKRKHIIDKYSAPYGAKPPMNLMFET